MSSCETTAKARNITKFSRTQNAEGLGRAAPEGLSGRRRAEGEEAPYLEQRAWQRETTAVPTQLSVDAGPGVSGSRLRPSPAPTCSRELLNTHNYVRFKFEEPALQPTRHRRAPELRHCASHTDSRKLGVASEPRRPYGFYKRSVTQVTMGTDSTPPDFLRVRVVFQRRAPSCAPPLRPLDFATGRPTLDWPTSSVACALGILKFGASRLRTFPVRVLTCGAYLNALLSTFHRVCSFLKLSDI